MTIEQGQNPKTFSCRIYNRYLEPTPQLIRLLVYQPISPTNSIKIAEAAIPAVSVRSRLGPNEKR